MKNELPLGWAATELHKCVTVLDNLRVPVNSDERAKRGGGIPYYGATGQVGWINDWLFNEELLLIGEDGAPFLDKSKPIAYLIRGKCWVNNHAHVLRANGKLTTHQYLKHYLDFFDFSEYVNGTTRLKLTQGSLNQIPVLLPPLAEQRRLVTRIDVLLTRVETCQKRLKKVLATSKRLRESVIAAACTGRLTADWRESHAAATHPDSIDDLPVGWMPVRIGDIIDDLRYGTSVKCSSGAKAIPVLRIPNMGSGIIDHADMKYAPLSRHEQAKLALIPGDILMIRSNGSVSLVGKAALVGEREQGFAFAGYLIRLRVKSDRILPQFLNYYLASRELRRQIEVPARSTSGVNNINSEEVRNLRLNLPPLEEQIEIVKRAATLLMITDRIESRYAAARKQVDGLPQSILAKAFRGELVPMEADLAACERRDYESAAQLLERIHATAAERAETRNAKGLAEDLPYA